MFYYSERSHVLYELQPRTVPMICSQPVWALHITEVWPQAWGGIVRVMAKLVQAAEAVLRGALEPLSKSAEGQQILLRSRQAHAQDLLHVPD